MLVIVAGQDLVPLRKAVAIAGVPEAMNVVADAVAVEAIAKQQPRHLLAVDAAAVALELPA